MGEYWKTVSTVLIALVLGLAVEKQGRDIAAVLSITVCCIALAVAVAYLEPVFDLLWQLKQLCSTSDELLPVLLKAVGITLVSEVGASVCADAGNASLGKTLHFLGNAAVLYLSIPFFRVLMNMIQEMIWGI